MLIVCRFQDCPDLLEAFWEECLKGKRARGRPRKNFTSSEQSRPCSSKTNSFEITQMDILAKLSAVRESKASNPSSSNLSDESSSAASASNSCASSKATINESASKSVAADPADLSPVGKVIFEQLMQSINFYSVPTSFEATPVVESATSTFVEAVKANVTFSTVAVDASVNASGNEAAELSSTSLNSSTCGTLPDLTIEEGRSETTTENIRKIYETSEPDANVVSPVAGTEVVMDTDNMSILEDEHQYVIPSNTDTSAASNGTENQNPIAKAEIISEFSSNCRKRKLRNSMSVPNAKSSKTLEQDSPPIRFSNLESVTSEDDDLNVNVEDQDPGRREISAPQLTSVPQYHVCFSTAPTVSEFVNRGVIIHNVNNRKIDDVFPKQFKLRCEECTEQQIVTVS